MCSDASAADPLHLAPGAVGHCNAGGALHARWLLRHLPVGGALQAMAHQHERRTILREFGGDLGRKMVRVSTADGTGLGACVRPLGHTGSASIGAPRNRPWPADPYGP